VSSNLFIIAIFLIFFFSILSISIWFLYQSRPSIFYFYIFFYLSSQLNLFFNFITHHFALFYFYIKVSPHSFNCYLFLL
jgi:hypothetical protein